jgi:hypothetical protein
LAFGELGFEDRLSIGTVRYDDQSRAWVCDPSEATEYDYEACKVFYWMPLPEPPSSDEERDSATPSDQQNEGEA